METNLSFPSNANGNFPTLEQAFCLAQEHYKHCHDSHINFLGASGQSEHNLIGHYKYQLPGCLGETYFYLLVIEILLFEPHEHPSPRNVILDILDKGQTLRVREKQLYLYYRGGIADYDNHLFIPSVDNLQQTQFDFRFELPPIQLPQATIIYAQFSAYDRFVASYPQWYPQLVASKHKSIPWTGSQAALTELIYALNEMGVLGGKHNEIRQLRISFEQVFKFDLGNIYKTYENMRMRKKSRTPFIDGLRNALLRRMDDDDLHAL